MKQLFTTLFTLIILSTGFSQTVYWTAYTMEVEAGHEQNVVNAIDQYMNSDAGKSMPAMSLSGKLFANSEQDYTHQIVFSTTDKAALAKIYTGILQQTTEFQLMGAVLSSASEGVGAYLGKSLYSAGSSNGNFSSVISLAVSDPATYLSAFKIFADAVNTTWGNEIGISLHQVLSGNEEDVSHIVVVTTPDFAKMLDFTDKIYSTPAFAELNKSVKGIRTVVSNTTAVAIKRYNVPE